MVCMPELFIKVAAVLLGCHIYVTSELCTETNPYNMVTPLWGESDHSSGSCIFIINNLSVAHFQSLTSLEEVDQTHLNMDSLKLLMKHQMVLCSRCKFNNSMETDQMPQEVQNVSIRQIFPCHHASAIHYLAKLNCKYNHCGSLNFMNELFRCCHNGKVHLESHYPYPEELKNLLMGRDTTSINF